jgi:uncharacterized membrane protein
MAGPLAAALLGLLLLMVEVGLLVLTLMLLRGFAPRFSTYLFYAVGGGMYGWMFIAMVSFPLFAVAALCSLVATVLWPAIDVRKEFEMQDSNGTRRSRPV